MQRSNSINWIGRASCRERVYGGVGGGEAAGGGGGGLADLFAGDVKKKQRVL